MAIAKVIYKSSAEDSGTVWMDTTQKTVTAGSMLSGVTALKNDGTGVTGSIQSQSAQTIHPSDTDQTIASGKYLTGTQTIKAVALTNLTAANIKKDVVVKVGDSTDDDCVTSVTGTYEGSGGGGGEATIQPITITGNGIYRPPTGVDGYGPVTVNVRNTASVWQDEEGKIHLSNSGLQKNVNFIDYDGSILYSYTTDEFSELSALPSNPSHTGLTAQGWNWNKSQIASQLQAYPDEPVWVGQMYITQSGKTEIDITLDDPNYLSPILTLGVNGTVKVNWGDGSSEDTVTGNSTSTILYNQHVYSSVGNYTITIELVSGNYRFFNNSDSKSGVLSTVTTDNNRRQNNTYSNTISAIRIGNGVSELYSYSFANCGSLTLFTIPSGVTSIGSTAFQNCYSLTSLTIPSGVTSIGNNAFQNCYSLTSLAIPSGVTSIGISLIQNCYSLTSLTIPSGVTSIGTSAFQNCYSLTSLTIPSGVTSIGTSAFSGCSSITSLTIPSGVTSIGSSMFSTCYSLTSLTIPSGVTSIGNSAFSNCYFITSLTIPSGVTSIGTSAFSNCYSITSLTIPSGVTSISNNAFYFCYYLTSITIPSGVTSIGNYAFYYCYSLTSLTIPSSVTTIGTNVFYNCRALTSLTIPSGVTSIGDKAFYYCYAIEEYHFLRATPPTLGTSAFNGIVEGTKIYVPAASVDDYKTATNWSTYASYIEGE